MRDKRGGGFPPLAFLSRIAGAIIIQQSVAQPLNVQRTLLGWSGNDSSFYMVGTDEKGTPGSYGAMDIKAAAQLMSDLGCYSAINLDGGGSTRMITGSPGNWTICVAGENRRFCTAVCACTK